MSAPTIPAVQNVPTILRRGTTGRVSIQLFNEAGDPVDAASLVLRVMPGGRDQPSFEEDFFLEMIAPFYHRIVKPAGTTGVYYIDWGDLLYVATVTGSGGVYPTNFAGGELLSMVLDDEVVVITFQAGDQTLAQVVTRINATCGPLFGQRIAFDASGELQLRTKKKGRSARIVINGPNATTPAVLTALGLTGGTVEYGEERLEESSCTGSFLFEWVATDAAHPSEETRILQTVYVVPGPFLQMLPPLRLEIDKAVKLVDQERGCFLGYSDGQLVQFLIGGMQTINAYQPAIFFTPDSYPYSQFGSTLIEAALVWGVTSQMLFAVDTDVPSYSDQGQSFVIQHQSALAAYLNTLTARLDKNIPLFKLHFVNSGTVLTQAGANARLTTVLDAAPTGTTLRNVFFRG